MKRKNNKRKSNKPIFFITLINFLIIILLVTYIIYLRFIPYTTLEYNGYAVSGKEIAENLLNSNFDSDNSIKALKVSDQDEIYQNLNSFYLGANKKDNINLNYPIYINNSIALYNLSSKMKLITDDFQEVEGYSGTTLTSGQLYNANTMQRADYYDYILLKNTDNLYINAKDFKIKTTLNEYKINMNSIINFTSDFISYYSLENDQFIYHKILDIDEDAIITVEDYNRNYTYKDFLTHLGIIKEKKQEQENNIQTESNEENKKENKKNTVSNNIKNTIENETADNKEKETNKENTVVNEQKEIKKETDEENNSGTLENVWIKPTVTVEDFTANVYTAHTNVKIEDPSRVINKAITFSFYKDDEIAFRASSATSGELNVTKLLPNTKYKIVGTYQYKNKEGNLIENTAIEQEITTKGVENLNPIQLAFENGQIYSNKIELLNLHINSDITDESIYGISKAEILINGTKYSIDSTTLRSLVKGDSIKYQSKDGIESNSVCNYEIKFYDTAGNEMNLKNNTGSTRTSKKTPSVKIKVSAQEVISVTVVPTIVNDDKVELNNYRYALYSENGDIIKSEQINENKSIKFDDLDAQKTYTIKLYADFDISDNKGMQYNQEIGNSTFTTLPLSKLGNLKLDVFYDSDTDITYNNINLGVAINTSKTDSRLIKILKNITVSIQDETNKEVEKIEINDISALSSEEGVRNLIGNLKSNTRYNIVITAKALQGSKEEKIGTTYTLNNFITNKLPASMEIKNIVVTNNLIDMDVYIKDVDNSCLDNNVTVKLLDNYEKEYLPDIEPSEIKSNTQIPTNQWVRITYTDLSENETYALTAEAKSYNETNDVSKVQNNYKIYETKFITEGLGGKIELTGLNREKQEQSSNLIDVKSENNWYSQCFDSLNTEYELDDANNANFKAIPMYNYEKTYTEDDNNINLKLLSNQCYVYDLSKYAGQTITLSFSAKITETNAKVYIQRGKDIGKNIEEIPILENNSYKDIKKTLTVPEDGYVGFYLEKYEEKIPAENEDEEDTLQEKNYYLEVKNLKAEIGTEATEYSKYGYDFYININASFIDKNHKTYDEDEQRCKYYIRLKNDKGMNEEYDYTYDSIETIQEKYKYKINETNENIEYTLELLIKQYGREYILSTVIFEYSPENKKEVKSISNIEEFKEIQPYGNYILLNDIDLTDANKSNEFTFGNPNISFYGNIDFNGKTIKKDTYSLTRQKETTSYVFYKLDEKATLKNMVIDYYINNTKNRLTTKVNGIDTFIAQEDGLYSLFLYNNAKIDNVVVNLKGCTQKQRINVGLLGYKNSGTINKFIINFADTLYGSQYLAGICLYSDGVIQNGYIYGNGIETIDNITIGDYRNVAGAVFQVDGDGLLQNIYNISAIKMNHYDSTYSYAANIVYNVGYPPVINEDTGGIISSKDSTAKVKNVYSVQPLITKYGDYEYYGIMDATNKEENMGPNILNKYTSTKVLESYYFCDVIYDANDYNTKSSATALYEPGVQDLMLNANGQKQFIIEKLVQNGYYPQLNLNYCMPKQDSIRIDVTGTEIIDVLSSELVKDNDISTLDLSDKVKGEIENYIKTNNVNIKEDNTALAVFRVYNPAGTTINEININYMDSAVMSQSYEKKVSTVYVLLNNPTSYLDSYDVSSVRSKMANGKVKESVYGENEDLGTRKVEVSFVKNISTAEEWNKINEEDENGVSGLTQNYRLTKDIDFASSDVAPYITGTFEGNIDGKYNGEIHTLKNITGTFSLIKSIDGAKIKNLYIENFTINTSSQFAGFIEKADISKDIQVDNIHIKNMEIVSSYGYGGASYGSIFGYLSSGSTSEATNINVQNCSVQGFNVDFENGNATGIRPGGIIGYLYAFGGVEVYVTNCFAQNIVINANVTSNSGVGGIIGYKGHDSDEKRKVGTPNFYIRNCYTTGKISTMNNAGGILGYGRHGNTFIQQCWSMVNITSKVMSGNAYIGGIAGYSETGVANISNNLYLGNIYVAGNNVKNVNRIYGENTGTTSYKNYAYKDQLINGEISTNQLGATKLLTYAECFQLNTYTNLLQFNDYYTYKIIQDDGQEFNLLDNEYLPELKGTDEQILPNQKMTPIDTDLKLDSITSTPSSDKTEVTVTMKFENKNNLKLTKVKIENDDMQVKDGSWNTTIDDKGLTVVTFVATPNRAYDSYKIESIYYERNGQEIEKEITTKIKVELYKGISNAQEWNEFFSGDGRKYEGQNVKITGDVDFSTVDKIENNVVIGKLEADSVKNISNVNITSLNSNSGFIKEIKTRIKNINFTDSILKGNGNYIGLIDILRGEMDTCTFKNCVVNCTGDYIGIVSRTIAGSLKNIKLTNVEAIGSSYVGALCGQATSLGQSANIEGTYIYVTGKRDNIGGVFGYTDGIINNVSAYQYSKNGKQASDKETEYLVKGSQNVGGTIGRYNGGRNTVATINNTNSIIIGTNYVGGNVGVGGGNVRDAVSENNVINATGTNIGGNVGNHGSSCVNLTSRNNTITGNSAVGGNSGDSGWASDYNLTSENNKISGKTNVGGCIGYQDHYYAYLNGARSIGTNQQVSGIDYVGGVVGRSKGRIKNAKIQDCTVASTGNYTGGIVGCSEYSTTSISSNNSDNYAVAGTNTKNAIITSGGNYTGGTVGYQVGTLYGATSENSTITASGNNVGGIAGFYTGYIGNSAGSISSSNFFLWHSYCSDSTIRGSNNVGGIAGNFIMGNIQYCYIANTSVVADNQGAGGLVGYFNNSNLNNLQYKANIKYNFIANVNDDIVITGGNSVGGLIGMTAKKLNYDEDIEEYNNVECNLIVTDISSPGGYIDIGIGSVSGGEYGIMQSEYMNNIYAYNCSKLNGVQIGGIKEEKDCYNLVSGNELKTNIYTKNEKITDEEGKTIGNKGLNFGTSRYNYNNGYFPILKNSYSANLYWSANELNINQKLIQIPNRTEEFTDENMLSVYSMPMNAVSFSLLENDQQLPEINVYSSDVDKINIEFSNINLDASFKITADDRCIIESQKINDRVYTIQYDYKTPINITVFNTSYTYNKQIKPEEIRNILAINNDEYLYLKDNTIYSNKKTISGDFVNLYEDKALDTNGEIYNIITMEKQNEGKDIEEIKLLDEQKSITQTTVNDMTIQTFAHCSKVIENNNEFTYKDQQLFIKNGYMYAIDGTFKNKEGAVILDSYNSNQYETVLGTDGIMYDLLNKIKYPEGFKNKDIIAMTNNISDNGNIVLVYYSSGKVYGFNYTTGEEVFDNNVKEENISLSSYIMQNLSISKVAYNMKKADYIVAQKLTDKLEKTSVEEALEKINDAKIEDNNVTNNNIDEKANDINEDNVSNKKANSEKINQTEENKNDIKDIGNKYVTVYDAKTQKYVVYSAKELTKTSSSKTQTENDKINNNDELISYYTNVSDSKSDSKNIGIIIIVVIVISIGFVLILLYRRTKMIDNTRER